MRPRITVMHHRAPGDVVVLTGLLRDLARAYGDRYDIAAAVSHPDLLLASPYLVPDRNHRDRPGDIRVRADYQRGIDVDQKRRSVHFLAHFHEDFRRQTGLDVPLTVPTPDLHLTEHERTIRPIRDRYWLVLAGGKADAPVKVWEADRFEETISRLRRHGLRFVQAGSVNSNDFSPVLGGVLDLVGKTSLRALMRLVYHADGVLCGVTCAMHMAAAFARPCVVVAGGREAWWWEAYVRENAGLVRPEDLRVPHRYLHTIGLLDCCRLHGCWKDVLVPHPRRKLCTDPVAVRCQTVPRCMTLITPEMVANAVLSYYADGTLPPIEERPETCPTTTSSPTGVIQTP